MNHDHPTDVIRHYFYLAVQADRDAYYAQFVTDAVVEDGGTTRNGIDEIRSCRT